MDEEHRERVVRRLEQIREELAESDDERRKKLLRQEYALLDAGLLLEAQRASLGEIDGR